MAGKALNIYLNDHLAGATLGIDLAELIRDQAEHTPLGTLMESLTPQIEADRQTLVSLMQRMHTEESPIKQAGAWVTGKATEAKFKGATSGERQLGTFMALESLALGVLGKLSLWKALAEVADQHPALAEFDLDELSDRARNQHRKLEHERLAWSAQALSQSHAHV